MKRSSWRPTTSAAKPPASMSITRGRRDWPGSSTWPARARLHPTATSSSSSAVYAAEGGGSKGRPSEGVWGPGRRPLTAGLVLTITLVAFEALAVSTVLPKVARDLGGIALYGWVFSAFMLSNLVGITIAGFQADHRGPAPVLAAGLLL